MARETPEVTQPPARTPRSLSGWVLIACAFAVPVIGFLMAAAMWWMVNGVPDDGRGLWGGVLLVFGVAVIGGLYWLAERYWINPRR